MTAIESADRPLWADEDTQEMTEVDRILYDPKAVSRSVSWNTSTAVIRVISRHLRESEHA
ncbi:hypothetical protein ACFQZ4_15710 [Catellatospora coxensis]|uniref:Uncharacterized protein n=1 Tax=Catellatospora coxensis TaxID=310354 RepID=A0A8J3P3Z4_9ACTN|nr:hypothetical protein [Catellatospora coxensis]GIG03333.1 hypothetical protein Cco03nite_00330 [Catellatospora coxensis]